LLEVARQLLSAQFAETQALLDGLAAPPSSIVASTEHVS
jgi:hypothetical protein